MVAWKDFDFMLEIGWCAQCHAAGSHPWAHRWGLGPRWPEGLHMCAMGRQATFWGPKCWQDSVSARKTGGNAQYIYIIYIYLYSFKAFQSNATWQGPANSCWERVMATWRFHEWWDVNSVKAIFGNAHAMIEDLGNWTLGCAGTYRNMWHTSTP